MLPVPQRATTLVRQSKAIIYLSQQTLNITAISSGNQSPFFFLPGFIRSTKQCKHWKQNDNSSTLIYQPASFHQAIQTEIGTKAKQTNKTPTSLQGCPKKKTFPFYSLFLLRSVHFILSVLTVSTAQSKLLYALVPCQHANYAIKASLLRTDL